MITRDQVCEHVTELGHRPDETVSVTFSDEGVVVVTVNAKVGEPAYDRERGEWKTKTTTYPYEEGNS
jgi:hypothetical protein